MPPINLSICYFWTVISPKISPYCTHAKKGKWLHFLVRLTPVNVSMTRKSCYKVSWLKLQMSRGTTPADVRFDPVGDRNRTQFANK